MIVKLACVYAGYVVENAKHVAMGRLDSDVALVLTLEFGGP